MTRAALVLVFLVACGGKGDELGKDWSGVALDSTMTSNVKNVVFEIQMPRGWKIDMNDELTKSWRPDVKDYFSEPSVMVGYESIPAKTLDEFIKDLVLSDKDTIEKKEMKDDYFLVVTHTKDHGQVVVHLMRRKGDANISCRAGQAKTGGVPNPKATMEWLEKLCQTLKIK